MPPAKNGGLWGCVWKRVGADRHVSLLTVSFWEEESYSRRDCSCLGRENEEKSSMPRIPSFVGTLCLQSLNPHACTGSLRYPTQPHKHAQILALPFTLKWTVARNYPSVSGRLGCSFIEISEKYTPMSALQSQAMPCGWVLRKIRLWQGSKWRTNHYRFWEQRR